MSTFHITLSTTAGKVSRKGLQTEGGGVISSTTVASIYLAAMSP